MNFVLTEDQESLRKTVQEFTQKRIAPGAAERDEKEIFPRDIYNEMGKLGLMGIPYPEEYGGAGMDFVAYALAVEEISKVDAGIGIGLSVHTSLCSWPIFKYGNEEQKQKFLKPLASGEKMGAFGLTEPNAGTDVGGATTNAVKDGDFWVLNGTKVFNTNGGEAEIEVIFALTNKEAGPFKGMSAFIVEKGTPGLSFGKTEIKMGIRSSVQREVIMENVRVPAANLLGKEGEGFKIAMKGLDGGRINIATCSVGAAQGALTQAQQYMQDRKQFGKSIASFQALQFKLADMATELVAARQMVRLAASKLDAAHPDASTYCAMAKRFATDVGFTVCNEALQLHGGYGYIREYPLERLLRDSRVHQILEGTNEIMRVIIARRMLEGDAPEAIR